VARQLTFSEEERARLATACKALGTTFEELVHWATLQALDELESYGRDAKALHDFYERGQQ
jgi:hypothetical protein